MTKFKSTPKAGAFLSVVALPFLALGCVAPTGDFDHSASVLTAQRGAELACFSVSASVVGLSDTSLNFTGNASVKGSVVLLGASALTLSGNAQVTDKVFTRTSDSVTEHGGQASVGALVQEDLTSYEPAILDFARQIQSLTPTLVLEQVASGLSVAGNGSLNVIQVKSGIHLSGNEKLTLQGSEADQFIFLVEDGGIALSGKAAIVISGEVSARKVLFLVSGNNSISVTGNASAAGTFLAPTSSALFSGNGHINGAFVAQGGIQISGNGLSFTPAAWCPQFDSLHENEDEAEGEDETSSPEPTASPSASPTVEPTPDPTPTVDPSPMPEPSPSPTTCTGALCTGVMPV